MNSDNGHRWSEAPKQARFDFAAVILLFGFSLYVHWPGLMSSDSVLQLLQAKLGRYTDWHPPLMSFWWRALNHIYFGPAGLLVFHNVLFFTGLYLFIRASGFKMRERLLAMMILTFMPSVMTQLGVIWKDTGLSCSFMLAAALLFSKPGRAPLFLSVALAALFYGTGVRHNAFFALVPLAYWMARVWREQYNVPISAPLLTLALASGIWLSGNRLNHALVTQWEHPSMQLYFYDLAGISVYEKKNVYPEGLTRRPVTLEQIQEAYSPRMTTQKLFFEPRTDLPDFDRSLRRAWLAQIFRHPYSYLRHRLNVFQYAINLDFDPTPLPLYAGMCPNPWGIHKALNRTFINLYRFFWAIRYSLVFRIYPYFVLTGLCISWAMYHRLIPATCLAASGFFYTLGYAIVGIGSDDFRLGYWTVTASLLSLLLVIHKELTKIR
jgi:hypothetical protein